MIPQEVLYYILEGVPCSEFIEYVTVKSRSFINVWIWGPSKILVLSFSSIDCKYTSSNPPSLFNASNDKVVIWCAEKEIQFYPWELKIHWLHWLSQHKLVLPGRLFLSWCWVLAKIFIYIFFAINVSANIIPKYVVTVSQPKFQIIWKFCPGFMKNMVFD